MEAEATAMTIPPMTEGEKEMGDEGHKTIEYSSLVLGCALAVQSILDLHILEMPGEHGKGMFRVRLEPRQEAAVGADEPVTLWARNEQGRQGLPLFSGLLEEMTVREEGGYREAELTVLSGTVRLDRKRRDRTFQNASTGYGDLVGRILADNEGSACILAGDDRETGAPFFQYRETDWEFLKRVASGLVLRP